MTTPSSAAPSSQAPPRLPTQSSTDLWKFFEERGSKLKESLFSVVTWIVGFAAALLGFAIKEGFGEDSGLRVVTAPELVLGVSLGGLLLIGYATAVVKDYADHINRTFGRANAARRGAASPQEVWDNSGAETSNELPGICVDLFVVLGLFAAAFVALTVLALIRVLS